MRIIVAIAVLVGVAEAGPTRAAVYSGLVANRDGSAWVLRGEPTSNDKLTFSLHRIVDRAFVLENVPTSSRLEQIAGTDDGALWVLTADSALVRTPNGEWRELAVLDVERSDIERRHIVPISGDRAIVLRTCFHCTDMWIVDVKTGAVDGPTRVGFSAETAVPDGQGGLWAIVPMRQFDEPGTVRVGLGGYAHFANGTWEAWTTSPDPIDGIPTLHHTDVDPTLLASDGRGGALVIRDDEVVAIDPAGNLTKRGWIMSRDYLETRSLKALIAIGDGALLVTGRDARTWTENIDPTPVLRWFDATAARERHAERLSTTSAWRAAHEARTPAPWIAMAGDTLWLVMPEVIQMRVHGEWQTLEANPEPPVHFGHMYSAPINIGYADRDRGLNGFSIGLRPEMMWQTDRNYDRFGFGGYLEGVIGDLGTGHEALLGGGLTLAAYGSTVGAALSVGADARYAAGEAHPQLVVSGFLGIRSTLLEDRKFESPFGLRLDVRPATRDVPGSATVSVAIDTIGLARRVYYGYAVITAHPH